MQDDLRIVLQPSDALQVDMQEQETMQLRLGNAVIPTGTTNYNELGNKPKINSITLQGNKSLADLGIQAALTFDDSPTEDSANPVKSGGVYTALDSKVNKSGDTMTGNLTLTNTGRYEVKSSNIDITSTPSSAQRQDVVAGTDTNGSVINFYRSLQETDGSVGMEFNARRTIGNNTKFNGITFRISPSGTRSVVVSEAEPWREAIGAVNIAGDTMTGALRATGVTIYAVDYPMLVFASSTSDTQAFGAVWEDIANRRLVLRQRNANTYVEDYKLPENTVSGAHASYELLTTKNPVTAFKDMSISITSLASGAWTQQSITQFTTPTGYVRTGISVVGGSTTDIRSYLYVLTNANANWVLLYNASGSAMSGTAQLRAHYILQSQSKEFTQ